MGRGRGQPPSARISDLPSVGWKASGKRAKGLNADYVLEYRNHKLAVVEAKAWDEELTEGVAQAKNYADKLASPLRLLLPTGRASTASIWMTGTEGDVAAYPTPDELWNRTFAEQNALARPLRRSALRGQGRLASRAATTRTSPSIA